MGVHKQSVSFTETAYEYARELVESGEYPTISAAVSGELARARMIRERDQALFEAELQRRISLPLNQWEAVKSVEGLFAGARVRLGDHQGTKGNH